MSQAKPRNFTRRRRFLHPARSLPGSGTRRNLSAAPPVNKRRGDTLGRRTPASACRLLGAAGPDVDVLSTSSFTVSGMDVLAKEFGSLTPEQLAAPIPTVEVSAVRAGGGRGWRRQGRRCRESLGLDGGRALSSCACSELRACKSTP